jgi:hypothetical protein
MKLLLLFSTILGIIKHLPEELVGMVVVKVLVS